ncbi:hypothetical protein HDV57DRAFT_68385 [Trichoderma longibrachiatum]
MAVRGRGQRRRGGDDGRRRQSDLLPGTTSRSQAQLRQRYAGPRRSIRTRKGACDTRRRGRFADAVCAAQSDKMDQTGKASAGMLRPWFRLRQRLEATPRFVTVGVGTCGRRGRSGELPAVVCGWKKRLCVCLFAGFEKTSFERVGTCCCEADQKQLGSSSRWQNVRRAASAAFTKHGTWSFCTGVSTRTAKPRQSTCRYPACLLTETRSARVLQLGLGIAVL